MRLHEPQTATRLPGCCTCIRPQHHARITPQHTPPRWYQRTRKTRPLPWPKQKPPSAHRTSGRWGVALADNPLAPPSTPKHHSTGAQRCEEDLRSPGGVRREKAQNRGGSRPRAECRIVSEGASELQKAVNGDPMRRDNDHMSSGSAMKRTLRLPLSVICFDSHASLP